MCTSPLSLRWGRSLSATIHPPSFGGAEQFEYHGLTFRDEVDTDRDHREGVGIGGPGEDM
jgi:hypothetical protein